MTSISATPVPTRLFLAGEDLFNFIAEHLAPTGLAERSVLAVTSKIVSLAEGAVIRRADVTSKMALVQREADRVLCKSDYGTALTIKHGILIPAAGIDESNSQDGDYILLPRDPYASARKLHEELRQRYGVSELGIIITDSHTHPLRRGVTGIGLAHWGFLASRDMRGQGDLFGRQLAMTCVNTLDALSVAAVYAMGEARERTPLALVQASNLTFTKTTSPTEIQISPEEDLYSPLYSET